MTNVTPLARLTRLQEVALNQTGVTDVTPLKGLEKVMIWLSKGRGVVVPEEMEERVSWVEE